MNKNALIAALNHLTLQQEPALLHDNPMISHHEEESEVKARDRQMVANLEDGLDDAYNKIEIEELERSMRNSGTT